MSLTYCNVNNKNANDLPANFKLPNIFANNNQNPTTTTTTSKWFALSSRQISRTAQVDLVQQSHKLQEYFSLSESISYGLYTAANKDSTSFALLAHNGRVFYAPFDDKTPGNQRPISCQLDHRQDPLSQFPWRYSSTAQVYKKSSPIILGAGALWLNAIEEQSICRLVDASADGSKRLVCTLDDKRFNLQLSFKWPFLPVNSPPQSIHFSHVELAQLEGETKLLQHTDVDLSITDFQQLPELNKTLRAQVDNLIELCESSIKATYLFPSLMKQLIESEHQSFMLSYAVRVYDESRNLTKQFEAEEWFSHELAQQTILRWDKIQDGSVLRSSAEKYFRLFRYKQPVHSVSDAARAVTSGVNYRMELGDGSNRNCNQVALEQIVGQLNLVSHLMHRKMHLVSSILNAQQPVVQRCTATLLGLSALLMNAADAQNKRELTVSEQQVTVSNQTIIDDKPKVVDMGYTERLEWILEDGAHRIYFFFITASNKDALPGKRVELRINNLHKLEVRSLIATKTSGEGVASYSERLLMELQVKQFSSNLYEDELEAAFVVPKKCNLNEDIDQKRIVPNSSDSPDEADNDHDAQVSTALPPLPPAESSDEPNYEFPTFDQFMDLAESYLISSNWDFDDVVTYRLSEFHIISSEDKANGQTQSRLDVNNCESDMTFDDFVIYLRYADQLMLRYEEESCYQVEEPNEWLETLSSQQVYGRETGEDSVDKSAVSELNSYGVAALWQIASTSPFIEYLGQSVEEADKAERIAMWRLVNDPKLLNISLLFKFVVLDPSANELSKKLELFSIELENTNSDRMKSIKTIVINNIRVKPNGAHFRDFVLPSVCNSNIERFHKRTLPEFPSFFSTFGAFPPSANFELDYKLYISQNGWSSRLAVVESNVMGKTGRLTVKRSENNWIFWLVDTGETLLQQQSSGQCKRVSQLEQFFNIKDLVDSLVGEELTVEDQRSNFLLANLWSLISARVQQANDATRHQLQVSARTKSTQDDSGQHQQLIKWLLADKMQGRSVEVTFEHPHADDPLVLVSIVLRSKRLLLRFMINRYSNQTSLNSELPDECAQQVHSNKLPSISSILRDSHEVLYMKSEIIVDGSVENADRRYFQTDEWINLDGTYRLRTGYHFTEESIDILAISDTKEFFDLSKPFKCYSVEESSDWTTDWLIGHLSAKKLLFGPLALLWLSTLPEINHQELTFSQLNAQKLFGEFNPLLFNQEKWRITHKTNPEIDFKLVVNASSFKLAVLDIEAFEEIKWHQNALVQVVNLKRNLQSDSYSGEELLIPIGYGCKRSSTAKEKLLGSTRDALLQDRWMATRFDYEASLSLAAPDRSSFVPLQNFQSGFYSKTSSYGVVINQRSNHYFNGSARSFKQVLSIESEDVNLVQVKTLDEQTGWCSIRVESKHPNRMLKLYFSDESVKVNTISINDDLFDMMSDYELIRYVDDSSDRSVILSYEQQLPEFWLNEHLAGSATVVRTFRRLPHMKARGNFYYHSEVKIDVFLVDKAQLTLRVENLHYLDSTKVLEEASNEDCHRSTEFEQENLQTLQSYQSDQRTFTITYVAVIDEFTSSMEEFETFKEALRKQFIKSLLSIKDYTAMDLMPTQLGKVSIEFDEIQRRVYIHFNLLEPPAAIEYFVTVANKTLDGSAKSISKLIESNSLCSHLCDQNKCLAFSYCADTRFCQVITREMISKIITNSSIDDQFAMILNNKLVDDTSCSFHYAPTGRIREPLDQVVAHLRRDIGASVLQQREGTIGIGNLLTLLLPQQPTGSGSKARLVAIELTELSDDNLSITSPAEYNSSSKSETKTFVDLLANQFIPVEAVVGLKQMTNFTANLSQATSRAECLSLCSQLPNSCQLISFCEAEQMCLLISNIIDWSALQEVRKLSKIDTSESCAILIEDFLPNYQQFTNTLPPNGYISAENNLTLFECAAKCQLDRQTDLQVNSAFDCLSFDFCIDDHQSLTSCYLQNMHIMMDDFDESILNQKQQQQLEMIPANVHNLTCSHYSKLLLADFVQQTNRKFANHTALEFKGATLDSCALICRRDDSCLTFEYCMTDSQSASSCYIQRIDLDYRQPAYYRSLIDNLEESSQCSVYQLKHTDEQYRLNYGQVVDVFEPNYQHWITNNAFVYPFAISGCLFAALVAGSLFQIMYTIITGRPMQLYRI